MMSKKSVLTVLFIGMMMSVHAQIIYTMNEIVEHALHGSVVAKQNETQQKVSYWKYITFKGGYYPSLRLSSYSTAYSKTFSPITQPDGTIAFRSINQTNPSLQLGIVQPIGWTNGIISANTSLNYFNNITSRQSQWNGNVMNISLSQPLFSFNALKWNKRIQPMVFEESKRNYVQQREMISRDALQLFFDLLSAQVNLEIANFNRANNDTVFDIATARYNFGTVGSAELYLAELEKLTSEEDVANAMLELQTTQLKLKSYIGLPDAETFTLILPAEIPEFSLSIDEALMYAKQNRSEYIAFTRRRIEADQIVAQAKGSIYQTSITATYGLNKAGPEVRDVYYNPIPQQVLGVSLNVPLVSWGLNRAKVETAISSKELADYIIAQEEVNFEQEVITLAKRMETLRLRINITKRSDEVARQRYLSDQKRYTLGNIDITYLNIAQTAKDAAKRNYLFALKEFWIAYYDLRRLTLYDFNLKKPLYMSGVTD